MQFRMRVDVAAHFACSMFESDLRDQLLRQTRDLVLVTISQTISSFSRDSRCGEEQRKSAACRNGKRALFLKQIFCRQPDS